MKKIWVTRSEPGAGVLAQQLQLYGYSTLAAPLIEIAPLESPRVYVDGAYCEDTRAALETSPELIIVLSAHAARCYLAGSFSPQLTDPQFVAVGQQTAAVLQHAGLQVNVPKLATSEGVIALPVVKALQPGSSVWLLAGVGGREVLAQYLRQEKGCQVVKIELYERKNTTTLPDMMPAQVDAVEVSSVQGLQAFYTHWVQLAGNMSVTVIVPSQRIAQAAQQLGFTRVHTAQGASAEAVLAKLRQILQAGQLE